ncbi:toxic anion resistance protein [Rhodopseudomonas palustris]|uniref:Toxic anion resistance protein n=1 Tax=Thiospirillum jenense TaxID=1653858 RepID=A0A839HEG7_9GAMM|nr:toxic anion resistance protein [Thiospirillum jenense]MBB1093583.1 toxic anion resistance protein [Rhodopseudomonas palustris]MBB1127263.1 toxic anion resistance protein [Thiospirillum jenense]
MPSSTQVPSLTTISDAVSGTPNNYCVMPNEVASPPGTASLTQQEMKRLLDKIDLSDGSSILHFGAKPQQQLAAVAAQVAAVFGQDTQPLHQQLETMMQILTQFDIKKLDPRIQPNWIARLFGHSEPLLYFLQQYLHTRTQLQQLIMTLVEYRTQYQAKITKLEQLYDAKLHYSRELERFIAAGEVKLHELDTETLPRLAEKVNASDNDPVRLQTLHDLHNTREDLNRRIEELRQARHSATQVLPAMQSAQEADKALLIELDVLLETLVPAWQLQLTEALRVDRLLDTSNATSLPNEVDDNKTSAPGSTKRELNRSKKLPSTNTMRRDVFDIPAIKVANKTLFDSLKTTQALARSNQPVQTIVAK